jgi:uncharacterized protein
MRVPPMTHRDRRTNGHPALSYVDHRPWPLPGRPWAWRQTWHDLLFAHWPVESAAVRHLVPASLSVQEFDGSSWIGVVPFHMSGVTLRHLPSLPGLSAFPELNLRLYVERDGKPGVWFLSLDAANAVAVQAARRLFHLPYHRARMRADVSGHTVTYSSRRVGGVAPVVFEARYGPASIPYASTPGSLEHWLTERYCLYAETPDGTIPRTDIHHPPWPLQRAWAEIGRNTLADPFGLRLDGPPALLHFSRRLDVVVWSPSA